MYKKDLDSLIAKNTVTKAILLYGESDFLISHYGLRLAMLRGPSEEHKKIYFSDFHYDSCKNLLGQSSLFGDKNIVILRLDKKLSKEHALSLIQTTNRNDDSFLILEYYKSSARTPREYGADTRSMAGFFSPKNKADSVRFFTPNQGESIRMLSKRAQEMKLNINNYLLGQLLQLHNNDIALAMNDLDKLRLIDGEIDQSAISRLCYGLGGVTSEETIITLLENKDIRAQLRRLIEEGEDEIQITSGFASFITQLFLLQAHIKLTGSPDSKAVYGYALPKRIEEQRAQLCIRFNEQNYTAMLTHLHDMLFKMKSGRPLDKNAFFCSGLMKLQALIK